MKNIAIVVMLVALSGCASAQIVRYPGDDRMANSPNNAKELPGIIKFPSGTSSARDDAYSKMREACGGEYVIVNENASQDGGLFMPVGSAYTYVPASYQFVSFACVQK